MAENTVGYGYKDDDVKQSSYHFGGNFGNTFMTKFEWTNNAGKDGAELEALDIVFNINGTERSYRQFPVSKVFAKEGGSEITDTSSEEYKKGFEEAMDEFSKKITQILRCYISKEDVAAAFATSIANFQQYCRIASGLLPANYTTIPLDIFLDYQWKPTGTNTKTYLQVPKTVKQGKFVCAAVSPVGKWDSVIDADGLHYIDDAKNRHPFGRSNWFMESNYAKQIDEDAGNALNTTTTANPSTGTVSQPAKKGW